MSGPKHKSSSRPYKPSKPADRHSSRSETSQPHHVRFLFVVNEIELDTTTLECDKWGNSKPPEYRGNYRSENPGIVFRYHNGTVTPAAGYYWNRPAVGEQGCIIYSGLDDHGHAANWYADKYTESTVFDLGPFFPCAYVLADASIQDLVSNPVPNERFYALHFDPDQSGSSRISMSGGQKYIAGSNANWLGNLVPEAYRNPNHHVPASTGLGGHIGVVLGLMALAEPPGRTNEAFSRHWTGNRWTRARRETVSAHGPPRGVLVHVALEPGYDPSQAWEALETFEWQDHAVRG